MTQELKLEKKDHYVQYEANNECIEGKYIEFVKLIIFMHYLCNYNLIYRPVLCLLHYKTLFSFLRKGPIGLRKHRTQT